MSCQSLRGPDSDGHGRLFSSVCCQTNQSTLTETICVQQDIFPTGWPNCALKPADFKSLGQSDLPHRAAVAPLIQSALLLVSPTGLMFRLPDSELLIIIQIFSCVSCSCISQQYLLRLREEQQSLHMWATAPWLLAEIVRPRVFFSCRVLKKCTQYVNESDTQTIVQLSDSGAVKCSGVKCHIQARSCAVSVFCSWSEEFRKDVKVLKLRMWLFWRISSEHCRHSCLHAFHNY